MLMGEWLDPRESPKKMHVAGHSTRATIQQEATDASETCPKQAWTKKSNAQASSKSSVHLPLKYPNGRPIAIHVSKSCRLEAFHHRYPTHYFKSSNPQHQPPHPSTTPYPPPPPEPPPQQSSHHQPKGSSAPTSHLQPPWPSQRRR